MTEAKTKPTKKQIWPTLLMLPQFIEVYGPDLKLIEL